MVPGPAILSHHQQEDHAWEPEQYECTSETADEIEDRSDVLDEERPEHDNEVRGQAEVEVGGFIDV